MWSLRSYFSNSQSYVRQLASARSASSTTDRRFRGVVFYFIVFGLLRCFVYVYGTVCGYYLGLSSVVVVDRRFGAIIPARAALFGELRICSIISLLRPARRYLYGAADGTRSRTAS